MTLGKDDWIMAGFRALSRGGNAAVKVEVIARELGATKGSFYWHFKDQAALKRAMLEFWTSKATDDVITPLAAISCSKAKIEALAEAASASPESHFGGHQLEAAIRDWGRYDPTVREAVASVDARRLQFTTELFADLELTKEEAATRAALFYAAYVGLLHRGVLSQAPAGERLTDFTRVLVG